MRRGLGTNLVAAAIAAAIAKAIDKDLVWIAIGATFAAGLAFWLIGRGEGLARLKIGDPVLQEETISGPAGAERVRYVRVPVTNRSRRLTAEAWGVSSVLGSPASSIPLRWRHEREPASVPEANVTDNPPATLGPRSTRELDVAISFDSRGELYAASVLSYRAPMLRHPELRIEHRPARIRIDVTGRGVRPASRTITIGPKVERAGVADVDVDLHG